MQMRIAGLLVLVLAGAACTPGPRLAVPASPVLFTVVTWNMHAGRGDLERLAGDLAAGRITGAPVREYVLLVQEAAGGGARDIEAVGRRLGLSTVFVPVRAQSDNVGGNAILATAPLTNVRRIDLPRERQPRAAVAADLDVAGSRIFVVSAHLENRVAWVRGGLFSDTARRRQAEALIAALPPDVHGIVGGDVNTWLGPGEPAWRVLAKRFADTPEAALAPTFRDRLVLDHLFFDLPDGWTATRQVVPDRYGSDHHPVVGTVVHASRF